jgi:hypothetical protein
MSSRWQFWHIQDQYSNRLVLLWLTAPTLERPPQQLLARHRHGRLGRTRSLRTFLDRCTCVLRRSFSTVARPLTRGQQLLQAFGAERPPRARSDQSECQPSLAPRPAG